MKWLEIIELRSAGGNSKLLASQMQKLVNEVNERTENYAVRAFCRLMIDTDFSIHLFHDSKKVEKSGSPLGLRLASALKEFGLVNHSIWIEMNGS
jgi:hypothetical protein